MSGFSAFVAVADIDTANASLEVDGYGPNCFAVPMGTDGVGATHAGLHSWTDAALRAACVSLGATVRDDDQPTPREDFTALATAHALEWQEQTRWFENPIMTGDERTADSVVWVSLIDFNVWPPGTVGWRRKASDGGPDPWSQPVGTEGAYRMGDRAAHNGNVWQVNRVDANGWNVWEPGVFGWIIVE